MSIRQAYVDGVLTEQWDDNTRTYTDFRTDPDTVRAYTTEENAAADARIAGQTVAANRLTIEQALDAALVTLQLIIDDTNANINAGPATRIKDLARVQRRIIRLLRNNFDGTA